jgi:hypothetical protein
MTDSQLPPIPSSPAPLDSSPSVGNLPPQAPTFERAGQAAAPAGPRGNGLGLASLIVGILAFFGAFVPFLNYGTGFIAFVGIVLGVIALLLKDRKKMVAGIGTAVSVVALILSIVLAVMYTAGFASAVSDAGVNADDSSVTAPADGESAEAEPAEEEQGSRDNPYPIGTTLSFSDGGEPFYDITVGTPTLNANDIVAAENMFNDVPPAGTQFAMLPLTVTYTGPETGTPWLDITVEFIAADGTAHTSSDVLAVGPAPLMNLNDLYTGGSGTGNVLVNVPSENIEGGTWLVRVGMIMGEETFFAAQ